MSVYELKHCSPEQRPPPPIQPVIDPLIFQLVYEGQETYKDVIPHSEK